MQHQSRSSDPFYTVSYYINWAITSWTNCMIPFYLAGPVLGSDRILKKGMNYTFMNKWLNEYVFLYPIFLFNQFLMPNIVWIYCSIVWNILWYFLSTLGIVHKILQYCEIKIAVFQYRTDLDNTAIFDRQYRNIWPAIPQFFSLEIFRIKSIVSNDGKYSIRCFFMIMHACTLTWHSWHWVLMYPPIRRP